MYVDKKWLMAALLAVVCGGATAVVNLAERRAVAAEHERAPAGDHWRNFDGHWSYWHEADKRWYYTDGHHWFTHNGSSWVPYQFNMNFGRSGFVPGGYMPPGPSVNVTLPLHGVLKYL
jgi:hypothetical protein